MNVRFLGSKQILLFKNHKKHELRMSKLCNVWTALHLSS